MSVAYILLGTNMGDREINLALSIQKINTYCGNVEESSSLYETAPWGYLEQDSFLNQVIVLQTSLSPKDLMLKLLEIEKEVGRIREFKFGPRIIDLDILLMDNLIVNEDIVTIPHPELHNRLFTLIPLAEVAASLIHPVLNKTVKDLQLCCNDNGHVQKFSQTIR